MKTFIKNFVLVITTMLLLALISYSWAEGKEVKRLKSLTVYSYTPPSQEIRYLQQIYYEGINDPIFKFSKDGGETWTTHDTNPVLKEGAYTQTALANQIEFKEKYNTAHSLGQFHPTILGRNEAYTRNVVSILQEYHDFIDGKSRNNTPKNRFKFLKLTKQSIFHAGENPYFDTRLEEIFKKLDSLGGDISRLPEEEQAFLTIELEYLERDYEKWLSTQKALELYSKSLKPEEMNENFLMLLELYEVSTIDLVRHSLETKRRAEASANLQQENCFKKN